jgi:predicted Rossmann fold nucleotide-binding protein DprA/Smf involved in DNA uptake
MLNLGSLLRGPLNRRAPKPHHYSRNFRSLRTKRRSTRCSKADEAMHLDEIIEKLEPELSSSESFAALFELELAGKVKQLPGKNFVRSF